MEVRLAGRLTFFYNKWAKFFTNKTILEWIHNGYKIPLLSTPHQTNIPKNDNFTETEKQIICDSINDLLKIGAVSCCKPAKDQFLSKIFLVPKPDGTFRFILNLKSFNKHVLTYHFKMEDIRTAIKLITRDSYLASVDLKDAYFCLGIHPSSKKYLRFMFDGKLYEFQVLPFGLSSAPYVFQKLIKPITTYLREQGLISVNYLDDFLFIGNSKKDCANNVHTSKKFLESLGFIINMNKSNLNPSKKCKFLGFVLDCPNYVVSIPNDKRINIYNKLESFILLKHTTVRSFASLIGTLISICPAIPYGMVYTKRLERHKFLHLKKNYNNFESKITLTDEVKEDLNWWKEHVRFASNPIREGIHKVEIYTDSSLTGWGIVCGSKKLHGFWNNEDKKSHINYLELKAIYFGLQCFAKDLSDCEILLRCDNTTAISYINRFGGIQYKHLNNLARKIWKFCEQRRLFIFASYIASKDNYLADKESRKNCEQTEWQLCSYAFNDIKSNFGCPVIDLFATRENAKCKKFVSWHIEPNCWAVDAFTISWTNLKFYAFPPFSLILKCLRKIEIDKAEGIMVVPFWPSQAWFPIFMSLKKSNLLKFYPSRSLLSSPFRDHHPLHQSLTLVAAVLSGKST